MNDPVALRYEFDGYGYKYIDSGSGSDWQTRIKNAEPLYTKLELPKHKASLTISHNSHKDYYMTVADLLKENHPSIDVENFVNEEDMQKCIDTDELWEIQWYPNTPVGFYIVCGSTLEIVLSKAMQIDSEE